MSLKILIQGALGRMGHALKQAAEERGHTIVAGIDLGDCVEDAIADADLAIDFSHHSATQALADCAGQNGVPVELISAVLPAPPNRTTVLLFAS